MRYHRTHSLWVGLASSAHISHSATVPIVAWPICPTLSQQVLQHVGIHSIQMLHVIFLRGLPARGLPWPAPPRSAPPRTLPPKWFGEALPDPQQTH